MSLDLESICWPNGGISLADGMLLQRCCEVCDPKTILEIGTRRGASTIVLASELQKRKGKLYCIDPAFHEKLRPRLVKYEVSDVVTLIDGRSPQVGHRDIPAKLDMLWIDGDHSTLGAMGDFIFWEPRVRKGGVVAFHDYSKRNRKPKRGSVETAVDLIMHERKDFLEIGFVGKADGGTIAFQKLGEPV